MFTRIAGVIVFTCGLALGVIGTANALPPSHVSVPEIDLAAVSGGLAMLAGGLLLLSERRRANK